MARILYPTLTTNPYLTMIVDGMVAAGHEVGTWSPWRRTGDADVLHLHWIETVGMQRLTRRSLPATRLAFHRLLGTIRKIQRGGGRVLWTAHNVAPHEQASTPRSRMTQAWIERIVAEVDVIISLSASAVPEIRRRYPSRARIVVVPHQHYRGVYPAGDPRMFRRQLGMTDAQPLVAMIGLIRPYKEILRGIDLFAAARAGDERMLIAGHCFDPPLLEAVETKAKATAGVTVMARHLSDQDFADAHAAATIVLCSQKKLTNSGSVMAALSLDTPVLAEPVGSLPELAAAVGEDWLMLESPLTPAALRAAIDRTLRMGVQRPPDLSPYAPAAIVARHLDLYLGAHDGG